MSSSTTTCAGLVSYFTGEISELYHHFTRLGCCDARSLSHNCLVSGTFGSHIISDETGGRAHISLQCEYPQFLYCSSSDISLACRMGSGRRHLSSEINQLQKRVTGLS